MKNFALIGVAGFVAVRHLKAIKDTGNNLLAALDKFDQVGVLDSYFPSADFFTEFERFDRHLDKIKRNGTQLDYISICTPNYLHDSHIRFTLKHGADAICEKPLVLNPWNVGALQEMEKETGHEVFPILQLRLHPSIIALKEKISREPAKRHKITLQYITSRGNWYHISWKGDEPKSGGIATNIGVHFFDMLIWIFGSVKCLTVETSNNQKASGTLELEPADVSWMLSIDEKDLPAEVRKSGKRTYRSLTLEDEEIEFSDGFTGLHTKSYAEILSGNGFGLSEAKPSIQLVHDIRHYKKK